MLITARNLALKSNYSVEESIKAMKWIEQERVKFYDKVYLHLKKKSSPLLSYYEDVFFETYEQVVDAYKRFKKLLVENDAYLKEQIARMNKEIIEKYGKNKRLHAILKERLQDTIIKIAQLKSSLQTKADLMKKRSKHPEWEEK